MVQSCLRGAGNTGTVHDQGPLLAKRLPASSSLATVDMKDFAGHEMRSLKIENSINDIADRAHPTDRVQSGQSFVRGGRVHWRVDNTRGNRIDADAPFGELDGKRSSHCVEAAFGQGSQRGGNVDHRLLGQTCGDVDDVARTLLKHVSRDALGDVKEAGKVDAQIVG